MLQQQHLKCVLALASVCMYTCVCVCARLQSAPRGEDYRGYSREPLLSSAAISHRLSVYTRGWSKASQTQRLHVRCRRRERDTLSVCKILYRCPYPRCQREDVIFWTLKPRWQPAPRAPVWETLWQAFTRKHNGDSQGPCSFVYQNKDLSLRYWKEKMR